MGYSTLDNFWYLPNLNTSFLIFKIPGWWVLLSDASTGMIFTVSDTKQLACDLVQYWTKNVVEVQPKEDATLVADKRAPSNAEKNKDASNGSPTTASGQSLLEKYSTSTKQYISTGPAADIIPVVSTAKPKSRSSTVKTYRTQFRSTG